MAECWKQEFADTLTRAVSAAALENGSGSSRHRPGERRQRTPDEQHAMFAEQLAELACLDAAAGDDRWTLQDLASCHVDQLAGERLVAGLRQAFG